MVFVRDGQAKVVVRRETLDDLIHNDCLSPEPVKVKREEEEPVRRDVTADLDHDLGVMPQGNRAHVAAPPLAPDPGGDRTVKPGEATARQRRSPHWPSP